MASSKVVYVGMVADGIHHGHINIIEAARGLGTVIVGLLSDEAAASYKRPPILPYEARRKILENIKGISKVVQQDSLDYTDNIKKHRPDILLHGDDWSDSKSKQHEARKLAILAMAEVGGTVVDIPYTYGISTTEYISRVRLSGRSQKTYFGVNWLSKILEENKRVLLITFSNIKKTMLMGDVAPYLKEKETVHFCDFGPNVKIGDIESILASCSQFNPDAIVCIGGGTAIDMGKLLGVFLCNDIMGEISKKACDVIAMPTTTGTGSECTHFATMYVGDKKHSIENEFIRPDYVILDPALSKYLPARHRASSGLDALCQGIESYWARGATEESMRYAELAISLAINNLVECVNSPNLSNTFSMLMAAHFSGKAIDISKTTLSHAISYPLTSKCGLPHGHACALTIGEVLKFNYKPRGDDFDQWHGDYGIAIKVSDILKFAGADDPDDFKYVIDSLIDDVGLDNRFLRTLDDDEIKEISDSAHSSERCTNNPRKVTPHGIAHILKKSRH